MTRDPRTDPRDLFAPGWLKEQLEATAKEVATWPKWMQKKQSWSRDAEIVRVGE